jgi:hypothetical protein
MAHILFAALLVAGAHSSFGLPSAEPVQKRSQFVVAAPTIASYGVPVVPASAAEPSAVSSEWCQVFEVDMHDSFGDGWGDCTL